MAFFLKLRALSALTLLAEPRTDKLDGYIGRKAIKGNELEQKQSAPVIADSRRALWRWANSVTEVKPTSMGGYRWRAIMSSRAGARIPLSSTYVRCSSTYTHPRGQPSRFAGPRCYGVDMWESSANSKQKNHARGKIRGKGKNRAMCEPSRRMKLSTARQRVAKA